MGQQQLRGKPSPAVISRSAVGKYDVVYTLKARPVSGRWVPSAPDTRQPDRLARTHTPDSPLDALDTKGLNAADLQRAIDLYAPLAGLRPSQRAAHREQVEAALTANVQIISEATQKQALRSTGVRLRLLLQEGYETFEGLGDLRHIEASSARTWVSRQRREGRLFTVDYRGKTLIPRMQLTEDGRLDEAVCTLIVRPLLAAGVDPWALWAWATRPTGLLSDQIPTELAHTNPRRVEKAVRTYIADRPFPIGA